MSVLPILKWPDPRLATLCEPIDKPAEMALLAERMLRAMYEAGGRGLAAPQVGVLARMFVMDPTWMDAAESPYVCINPEIVARSGEKVVSEEACLSIPGVSADVDRHAEIILRWQDVDGVWVEKDFTDFASVCVQHEIDHLDGVVIFDRVDDHLKKKLVAEYEAQQ